jgi:UDP:flavonoid glycosyltransferase YjiC (YdhE family)
VLIFVKLAHRLLVLALALALMLQLHAVVFPATPQSVEKIESAAEL